MNQDNSEKKECSKPDTDEFLTLADIVRMVWRHRRTVSAFTVAVAFITAVITLFMPRPWEASSLMEVIPEYGKDGRVDKDFFENTIMTHLETAKSPAIGMLVLQRIGQKEQNMTLPALMDKIKVTRPPKTSLIECKIKMRSADTALSIVTAWREECLKEIRRRTMEKMLIFARGRLRDLQEELLKTSAAVEEAHKNAKELENEKLLTLSRSVDDVVLWQDLVKSSDAESLSRMTNIYLKTQALNTEYLEAKNRLALVQQEAAGMSKAHEFYRKVALELDKKLLMLEGNEAGGPPKGAEPELDTTDREAAAYVETISKAKEVIPLGEATVYRAPRGALKKTALAALLAFAAACLLAFLREWMLQINLE